MPPRLTTPQLIDAFVSAGHSDTWCVIDPQTIRYTETIVTPDIYSAELWAEPTYRRHIFLTLTGTRTRCRALLGVVRAPWTGRQDTMISLTRASKVLDSPESFFATPLPT